MLSLDYIPDITNTHTMNVKTYIFFFCLGHGLGLQAQQVPAEDIAQQTAFLEAKIEAAKGRPEKAIDKLLELYKDDRTNPFVAFELAKNYKELKQFELVDKYAKTAIDGAPENEWINDFYAQFLLEQNRPEAAINPLTKLYNLQPTKFDYFKDLVDTYVLVGQPSEALKVTESAIQFYGNTIPVLLKKFELCLKIDKKDEAEAIINTLTTKYNQDIELLKIEADYYLETKQEQKAMESFKKVLAVDPSDTDANLALLGQGSPSENENAYLRALLPIIQNEQINMDAKVKEVLPFVDKLAQGKDPELKGALLEVGDKLIQTHPEEAASHALYGDILLHTGNLDKAITQYEASLQFEKKNFAVWEQLMYAYDQVGNYKELATFAEKTVDFYPNQASPYIFKALADAQLKDTKSAQEWIEEALVISGGNNVSKVQALVAKGYILGMQSKYKEAQEAFSQAEIISSGQNYLIYERMGDVAAMQNKGAEALKMWEKSAEKGNNSVRILQKINGSKI